MNFSCERIRKFIEVTVHNLTEASNSGHLPTAAVQMRHRGKYFLVITR